MTAFVLAAGGHTGDWVWRDVARLLRESGAEAYPATLTGMGDRRHLAGPETDLATHIEDLVQIIDHIEAPAGPGSPRDVVLVGHCYGSHPVLGAADRRPERVSRIVYADAPLPGNGLSVHDLVRAEMAEEAVRERILGQADRAEDGWRVPAPTREEWERLSNVHGVSPADVTRLARLAAPQPLRTLTQPLRLTGAADGIPASGIFCTVNGTTDIALVEKLVASGAPRFRQLADPRWTFFELPTGHWPMLSTPEALTRTLLRAAAGEGHRLAAQG
ncbi:alpha/beta fold hydrolase [Streptomyces sp. HNM0574]|uniref:alpha/beta fold hydrolase n=1 Tax=Streptomyces sp. HNM0574 TaxID=2714954 RepID=UPI00146F541F|nr:alpha/beta fold hydrolase [Streptomyces sp. HNM0574]NLU70247.1 alpha/beta fold hydrolase [Streptomyces sp. HNM0574]